MTVLLRLRLNPTLDICQFAAVDSSCEFAPEWNCFPESELRFGHPDHSTWLSLLSADRPLPTDTSFTCPSLLKKKKTGSKMALKCGRQTSQGWYATATSVKLGETADWDIFDMSAELTCWTTLLQCLSKLAVGSLSHLANLKTGKFECYRVFLTFISLSQPSRQHCTDQFIYLLGKAKAHC